MLWKKRSFGLALVGVAAAILMLAPAESQSQDKKTYKVAYIGPLTGPNTSAGMGTRNSLDLAIKQADARGALPFKLELISVTDDSKPSVGVGAVQKMCSDPEVVLVSAHWNSPCRARHRSLFREMRAAQYCGWRRIQPHHQGGMEGGGPGQHTVSLSAAEYGEDGGDRDGIETAGNHPFIG